jgi:hypothetical protein
MNTAVLSANETTVEEYSLGELQQWLQYAKHSWSLAATTIFVPYGFILMAIKTGAYVFTPYMLWHLYQAKWYKTVGVLFTVIVLPLLISQIITLENNVLYFMLLFFPFLNFYIFTYVISFMIREQMTKIKTLKRWKREEMSY